MKELLATVLAEGKTIAATPANKNVAVSHAYFAQKLTGQEEILIVEYGEGQPGDVARFNDTIQPTYGVITGLAPAHLDKYKTLRAAAADIFTLADYLHHHHVYLNGDSQELKSFIVSGDVVYDQHGLGSWKVRDVDVQVSGLSFRLVKADREIRVESGLLGRHQVGPLSMAAVLAYELGLHKDQIEAGLRKTVPYEHRMQPRLVAGAWVIDDTYNGNLEGLKAGVRLLLDVSAKRKLYVTPGLVDQGAEAKRVHQEVGRVLAEARFDKLILIRNSVTDYILAGLNEVRPYTGEVVIEDDPLRFYTNLEHFLAAGDVMLMQNDWTDNYA